MTAHIASAAAVLFNKYDNLASSLSITLLSTGGTPEASSFYSSYRFIDVLALAQRLQVQFLPITWQATLGAFQGGQADIYQSLINAETSLAFKLFRNNRRTNQSQLQEIINEIVVLTHPIIWQHPHVVRLEGICWDIPLDESISPALVFEKTQFGDLHRLLRSPLGKRLPLAARLNICVDIGIAVRDMHSNGILHGDLKPENILMFKNEENHFVARVADFGYSTRFCTEDDWVMIPKSFPWNAPEWHTRRFSVSKAKLMDIYSFGAVCLWILFEREDFLVTNKEEIPTSTRNLGLREGLVERASDCGFFDVSSEFVSKDDSISGDMKLRLHSFFAFTLARDPTKRSCDFNHLLHQLLPERILPSLRVIDLEPIPEHESFRIESSFNEFCDTDFRLRPFIARELQAMASDPGRGHRCISPRDIFLQLALCYQLGFGVVKDTKMAKTYLDKHGIPESELDDCVASIRDIKAEMIHQTGLVNNLMIQGYIYHVSRAQQYREEGILGTALETCRKEIESLQESLSNVHPSVLSLKSQAAKMLKDAGNFKEAETLDSQVIEASNLVLGAGNQFALNSMMNLASNYQDQGRLGEAEVLKVEILDYLRSMPVKNFVGTLGAIANLATTYRSQGRWEEAEVLEVEILEKRKLLLGEDHVDTLSSMANLANTYWRRGRWNEAEQLEMQVSSRAENSLGAEHPLTMIWTANLASTYHNLGRLKDALDLRIRVSEAMETLLGPEHPNTLLSMGEIAPLLRKMGRWQEAEMQLLKVLERKKKVLGMDHPSVLISMSNLASVYQKQGRYKEAEDLEIDVMEKSSRILGEDHPDTLASEGNLASCYRKQKRWKEAEKLERHVLQVSVAKFGEDHPDTLLSMASLGAILYCQGRYDESENLLSKAFHCRKQSLGLDHPSTLTTAGNLALAYLEQGKLNEAEELEMQVLKSRMKVLGKDHPDTITSIQNLAIILERKGLVDV